MPDIVTGKIFVDGEKGITATKMNQIISQAVVQPDFFITKPASSTLDPTDTLLEVKNTGAYAKITGQQLSDSVATSPSITAMRLRSFNAIGNPNFEVDQRKANGIGTFAAGTVNAFQCDRWFVAKVAATGAFTAQTQVTPAGAVKLPGTNYFITNSTLGLTVSTVQASLAATEYVVIQQYVEGPQLRELLGDTHSISVLVSSSVALNFSIYLRTASGTNYSLTKLCSHPGGNVYTLFTLSNLPVWPGGATWSTLPGVQGYYFGICLGAGANWTGPADTWQTSTNAYFAATGTTNWLANSGASFSLAFCQHEPGAVCTTLQDLPFGRNLDGPMGCLRYYTKSYSYPTAIGTVTSAGMIGTIAYTTATFSIGTVLFKKIMAKVPTVTLYNHATGAINSVQDQLAVNHTGASANNPGDGGFWGLTYTTATTAATAVYAHYVADTNW